MQEYRLVMQYKNSEGRFINNDVITTGEVRGKHKYSVSFKLLFDMLLKCIFPSLVANRY